MKKKILFLLLVFSLSFSIASFLRLKNAEASAIGWLWGGSTDGNGNSSGVGWVQLSDGESAQVVNTDPLTASAFCYPDSYSDASAQATKNSDGTYTLSVSAGSEFGDCSAGPTIGNTLSCENGVRVVATANESGLTVNGEIVGDSYKCSSFSPWSTPPQPIDTSYGVNIPLDDGPVTGYAWSSNLGWIDFNSQDHCISSGTPDASKQQYLAKSCINPSGTLTGVSRSNNKLVGWARFVSIARESANDNSGGWEGWINLNASESLGYKVDISAAGVISGYAWSSELGALQFSDIETDQPPVLSLTANPSYAFLAPGESFPSTTKDVNLSWTVSGQEIQSCTRSCNDTLGHTLNCAGWTDNTSVTDGNVNVTVPALSAEFVMTCTDKNNLSETVQTTVNYGCAIGTCDAITQTCQAHSGTFNITSSGDASVCKGGCTADSDCVLRQGSNWREVAP